VPSIKLRKEEMMLNDGWEYASRFGKKYKLKKSRSHVVRRRRYHRERVFTGSTLAPVTDEYVTEEQQERMYSAGNYISFPTVNV